MTNEELYKVFLGAIYLRNIGRYSIYSADGFAGIIENGDGHISYYKTEIGFRQTIETLDYVENYVNGHR